jgi:hypothetical protein
MVTALGLGAEMRTMELMNAMPPATRTAQALPAEIAQERIVLAMKTVLVFFASSP